MKTLFSITMLALVSVLYAQSIEEFTNDFERQKALTIAYVEAMPADMFEFKPNEDVRTFAQQMLHLAQGTFNISSNGTGGQRMYAKVNLEKVAEYQSGSLAR